MLAPYWSPARVARTARDRVRSQRCQSPSPAPGPNNRPTGPLSGGPGKTRANLRSRRACLATRTRPSGQNGNASPRPSKVAAMSGPLQNPGLRVGSARAPGTSAESASFGATDLGVGSACAPGISAGSSSLRATNLRVGSALAPGISAGSVRLRVTDLRVGIREAANRLIHASEEPKPRSARAPWYAAFDKPTPRSAKALRHARDSQQADSRFGKVRSEGKRMRSKGCWCGFTITP